MGTMKKILCEEIMKYAGEGLNVVLYPLLDDFNETYSVIGVDTPRVKEQSAVFIALFARIETGQIVIEIDNTDKPLLDALLQRGILRQQIVLAYAGETLRQPIPQVGQ